MTTKSWDRTMYTGIASPGFAKPSIRDGYSQSGTNATHAEKLAGVYNDHAYSMSRSRWVKPACIAGFGTGQYNTSTDTFGAQPTFDTVPLPDINNIIVKLLSKWRNSDLDLGVTIGEGREAVGMMTKRLSQLASSANLLRKGNFGGAIAVLGGMSAATKRAALREVRSHNFANAWLELQYGWKPLVNDIYSASDFVKLKGRTGTIRASDREINRSGHGTSVYPAGDMVVIRNDRRRHLKVEVGNVPDSVERLGLSDPFNVMWNLVPWSFVVDWFLPIGDVLQAQHARRVMKIISCCDTSVFERVCQMPVRSGQKYGSFTCLSSAIAEFNYVTMTRVVSTALPPSWGIVEQIPNRLIPTWDPSLLRLANGAALVRSSLGKLH